MNPTPEQADALQKFLTGDSLKIEACAGAGKTTTLKMLARATTRRGLYLAFNKAIATEAGASFPAHVSCRTGHSLAFAAFGRDFARANRLRNRVSARQMLEATGPLGDMGGYDEYAVFVRLLRAVTKFCESSRPRPSLVDFGELDPEHELDAVLMGRGEDWLGALWARMSDVSGHAPITHDVYLKVWALSGPRCPADFVLFDEAQDGNGVLLGLLRLWERRDGAQIVAVGDRYQQIYSWRGAINAMERYETTRTSRLTQSFRYGEEIASAARVILAQLRGVVVPIRGTDSDASVLLEPTDALPDAVLTRTNAVALGELIALHEGGVRVAVAGGVADLITLLRGVEALKQGRKARCHELEEFATWSDVVEASELEDGADLRVLVRTVEDHELSYLIGVLEQVDGIEDAQVTISTAHRSKGLEWEHVRLAGDFKVPEEGEDGVVRIEHEEAHLLYVAATRARTTLDVSCCPLARYALARASEEALTPPAPATPAEPARTGGVSGELLERLEELARSRDVGVDELLEGMLEREEWEGEHQTQGSLFS